MVSEAPVEKSEKKKSRFSFKSPKKTKAKDTPPTPEKETAPSVLLSPQLDDAGNSDSEAHNKSVVSTPEVSKKNNKLNLSFRKKKKGARCVCCMCVWDCPAGYFDLCLQSLI